MWFIHIFSVLVSDVDAFFLAKYRWKLDDGVLTASPDINPWYSVDGYNASDVKDQFVDALNNELPKRIRAKSLDLQTNDVLGQVQRVACTPSADPPCAIAAFKLAVGR